MKTKTKSRFLRYSIGFASVFVAVVLLLIVLRVSAADVAVNIPGLSVTHNGAASTSGVSSSGFTASIKGKTTTSGCSSTDTQQDDTFKIINNTGATAHISFGYTVTFPNSRASDKGYVKVGTNTYDNTGGGGSINTTLAAGASINIEMKSDAGDDKTTTVAITNLKFGFTVTWKNINTIETDNYVAYNTQPKYDGTEPKKASTAEYDYTFDGWEPALSAVTKDITYNARFTATKRSYLITWQNEDGSLIDTTTVEHGKTPTHDAATKTSTTDGVRYVFTGWNPTPTAVTGTATYKATFKTQYQITWNHADDADNPTVVTEWVDEGKTPEYTGTEPTKAATAQYTYDFKEWTPAPVAAAAPATYTATYDATVNKYTITWQNEDGSQIDTTTVEYGETPTHDAATKTSTTDGVRYVFTGWNPTPTAVTGTATYKATFKTQYQITWNHADDADNPTVVTEWVDEGKTPEYTGTEPTKAATAQYTYDFKEWTPAPVAAAAPATYTATYDATVNKYTITWTMDDDTVIDTTEVKYGSTPTHADATKTSSTDGVQYVFTGWDPAVVSVTGAATYKATFKTQYQITWDKANGTDSETEWVDAGVTPSHADPTKEADAQYTYDFKEWTPAPVAAAAPATYTATYTTTTNKYTITWQNEDGSQIDTTQVEYGTVPTHADATKDNTAEYTYTFAGWTPEVVAVTGEATYKATYTATKNKYTITWKNDDGSVIDTTDVEYGTVPTHADATKAKTDEYTYTFDKWTPEVVAVTGAAEYQATFTATKNKYTITWKNDDGSVIDTTEVEYGTVPTHADATKDNTAEFTYTFAGWDPEVVAVTGEAVYKATFTATTNTYTVTWNNYDGSELEKDENVPYGTTPTYNGATPTKPSTDEYTYIFDGWDSEVKAVEGNVTYTAKFKAVKFFAGNTISLKEAIYLNFYIDPTAAGLTIEDVTEGDKTIKIDFEWETTPAPKSKVSECSTVISKDNHKEVGNYFVVSCKVCAAEMSCIVKATGTVGGYSKSMNYSVREYGEKVLNPNSEFSVKFKTDNGEAKYKDLVDLIKKTLDYGAKAQAVFGIIPDDPANSILSDNPNDFNYYSMSDVTKDMVEDAIYATNNKNCSNLNEVANDLGAKLYGTSLFYLSDNTLRIIFTKETAAFNPSDYGGSQSGTFYFVDKAGIPAAKLDVLQQFTVGSVTFFYSPLDYAKAVIGSSLEQPYKDLAKSLYWYNQAAKKYFFP